MHIERVHAHAFGPLRDELLELGPGCNVVHGPNESGKSTWHAALTTAVAGRKRGRGQPAVEKAFADRHRPWDGGRWAVGVRLALADGRIISILQDLDDPSRCEAHDQVGRPVLDEILGEGMPDASRWLGLDREAFRACASVLQSDVARVGAGAGALQQYLQQAASTRRAESTAGAALDRLRAFKAEAVGTERRNAVKPLRRAIDATATAQHAYTDARAAHGCLIDATEACGHLAAEAERLAHERRAAEAVEAAREADRLDATTARIAELTAACPEPPPALDQDDDLAQRVGRALARWQERPPVPDPPPRSSEELRAELAAPPTPVGDTEVHPSVEDAVGAARRAHDAREFHARNEPAAQALPAGTEPVELRQLAARLRAEPPPAPAAVAPSIPPSVPLLIGAATLAAAGALALAGAFLVAALVAVVGGALAAIVAVRRTQPAEPPASAPPTAVRARLAELDLAPEPSGLELLAERAERHRAWVGEEQALRAEARRAATAVREAVGARLAEAPPADAPLGEVVRAYQAACRAAAEQQRALAAERGRLETALARAEAAEERIALAGQAHDAAAVALQAVGAELALSSTDAVSNEPEALVAQLVAWQAARRARLADGQARRDDWDELQRTSGGRPLAAWVTERDAARDRARSLAADLDPDLLARVRDQDVPVADRIASERAAARHAHEARAALEVRQADAPSVAEAAEAVAAAEAELRRVTGLDDVLTTTIDCLEEAQDRLYRSLAPVLADRLGEVLPAVTSHRYDEVTVDPETLEVRVRLADGSLRSAGLLSHGTAEQVYLVLRVAMAERIVATGESCPLLLDDVTVHCDPARTQAILALLARVAEDRQVVLFTQETDVVTWAERTLTGDRHRVIALDRASVPA